MKDVGAECSFAPTAPTAPYSTPDLPLGLLQIAARIAANRRPYNENKFAASIYKHNGYITESIMGSITGFMTIL